MYNRESVINSIFSFVYNGIHCSQDSSEEIITRACTALRQRINGFYSEGHFVDYVNMNYPDSPLRPGPKIYNIPDMRKGVSDLSFKKSTLTWVSDVDPIDDALFFSQNLKIFNCIWFKHPSFTEKTDCSDMTFDRIKVFYLSKGKWVESTCENIPFFKKSDYYSKSYFSTFDNSGATESFCKSRLNAMSDKNLHDAFWDTVVCEWILKTDYYTGSFFDIDFVSTRNGKVVLYEIKQKYPSSNNLYGIDLWKAEIYRHIGNACKSSYYYIIRETNKKHEFKKWIYISFSNLFSLSQKIQDGKPGSRFKEEKMKSIMVNRFKFKRM